MNCDADQRPTNDNRRPRGLGQAERNHCPWAVRYHAVVLMTPERLDRLRVRYKHVKRELARKAWLDDGSFASLSHLLGGEAPAPMYGFQLRWQDRANRMVAAL